jgi:hypothetical protein
MIDAFRHRFNEVGYLAWLQWKPLLSVSVIVALLMLAVGFFWP